MRLIGYTCTYNEEKMIPYVMPYVERLGYDKFIVYDNMSTDNTVEELKKYPFVEVRTYDTGGNFDEKARISLFYKSIGECKGMIENDEPVWMTWTDFDEVLYTTDSSSIHSFRILLYNAFVKGYNAFGLQMYNLLNRDFPSTDKLVHHYTKQCQLWSFGRKTTVLLVNDIYDVVTDSGFHNKKLVFKSGKPKIVDDEVSLYAFHLKYIDKEYIFEKNYRNAERQYIVCYEMDKMKFNKFYSEMMNDSIETKKLFENKINCQLNLNSGVVDRMIFNEKEE